MLEKHSELLQEADQKLIAKCLTYLGFYELADSLCPTQVMFCDSFIFTELLFAVCKASKGQPCLGGGVLKAGVSGSRKNKTLSLSQIVGPGWWHVFCWRWLPRQLFVHSFWLCSALETAFQTTVSLCSALL